MILIDTSAWIEFLWDTGSPTCDLVDEALKREVATCDAVRMEILAGARDESHLVSLRHLLARTVVIPIQPTDYDDAALLYRTCRSRGETIRKLIDYLIASIAIRGGVPVLHNDADVNVLARHTQLRNYEPERP